MNGTRSEEGSRWTRLGCRGKYLPRSYGMSRAWRWVVFMSVPWHGESDRLWRAKADSEAVLARATTPDTEVWLVSDGLPTIRRRMEDGE